MTTINGVKFRKNLVPANKHSIKCPYTMNPKKITIHCTDNSASAENEIAYMIRNDLQVSFHNAVDENGVVQGLLYNRNGWHAGDGGNGYGNRNTIGVEMCRSYDRERETTNLNEPLNSQFEKTFNNTIKFVAQLCVDLKIVANASNIKQHKDWSGKPCPRKILNDGTWNKLVNAIIKEYERLTGKSSSNSGSSSNNSKPKPQKPSNSGFKVGQKVTVKKGAKTYQTGENIPNQYKGKSFTVQQVGNGRLLLKELYSWVRISDVEGGTTTSNSNATSKPKTFAVGGKATIKSNAKTYATGENIPARYKGKAFTIQQVKSGQVLLKELYSWVRTSDLVGGTTSSGTTTTNTAKKKSYKAGNKVTLNKSASKYATGENIPNRYKGKRFTVQQVKSDRLLLKELYSWVYIKDVS